MLHLHRAERADVLVDALGDVLRTPLPDPLQAEVVAVPTRGVERWLTQRLAHSLGASAAGRADGVCGNVEFPFPGRLVGDALGAACGVDREHDPWRAERAVWPLLDILDDCMGEPWLTTVAGHLGVDATTGEPDPARAARRFGTVRHITDLYDRYAVHRPAMVRGWAAGHDAGAAGGSLPEAHAWQAELWRRLRERIGEASPAERLGDACARLRDDADVVELPPRLAVFGLTRLPASYLDVLRALATHRDVHLFLLHPSPVLWERVAGAIDPSSAGAPTRRADDPTAGATRNPLLRSWGRDAREMQLVVADATGETTVTHHPLDAGEPRTLLQRLQAAVRADEPPAPAPLGDGDESVRVHACHGKARQVEVLRDAILHLLAGDPTLEPRDVIVMCPDIETFAPLIHATFGGGSDVVDDAEAAESDGPRPADLRVRLADRSLRQTNPVLGALSSLLAIAASRVTSTQVLDFAGRDPVRARFGFDDDDLARVKEWVSATGVRWGLDGPHRAPFQLQRYEQNTWRAGLDRVLVGVAVAEDDLRLVDGVLPLDDVESGSIELAGRFAELVDRLHAAVVAMQAPATVEEWAARIAGAADALFATDDRDTWQRAQLLRLLDELRDEATAGGTSSTVEISLAEVRNLLADRLRGRPTRANFRTGHLTVCTLVPMRSVPHRVVCLLGLDDDAFPRKAERDGDDLVALEPFVGDGDGGSEDRQLLLDALLAAKERLVITYSGHDDRTNAPLPPSVPVGELLDVLDATAAGAREQVVTHHPLQPFDPRNFEPGRLGAGGPWSFDRVTLDGARAITAERGGARPSFLAGPLAAGARREVVELDSLVKFVQHPVRAFLRERLGISLADFSEELSDAIPLELDSLEKWAVGDRILAARLAGADLDACTAAERARGAVPPGRLADRLLDEIHLDVQLIVDEVAARCGGTADVDSVEVAVRLDDGRLLVGTVAGVVGSTARAVSYSRLGPKHRLASWARFLALRAGRPTDGFDVVTIGRSGRYKKNVAASTFAAGALDPAAARRRLHDLVDLYDRGMCEPLPVYCATTHAYAAARAADRDPVAAAVGEWETEWGWDKEDREPEHRLVLGGDMPFASILATPACDGDGGDGWDELEPSRFARYAERLWGPVLDLETLEHR